MAKDLDEYGTNCLHELVKVHLSESFEGHQKSVVDAIKSRRKFDVYAIKSHQEVVVYAIKSINDSVDIAERLHSQNRTEKEEEGGEGERECVRRMSV